jgi:hypothetical protein
VKNFHTLFFFSKLVFFIKQKIQNIVTKVENKTVIFYKLYLNFFYFPLENFCPNLQAVINYCLVKILAALIFSFSYVSNTLRLKFFAPFSPIFLLFFSSL